MFFLVKDLKTRQILLQCDSTGELYPVSSPSAPTSVLITQSQSIYHQRLGHPSDNVLRSFISNIFMSSQKEKASLIC